MLASAYKSKYSPTINSKFKGGITNYWKIDATTKWVEYQLDIYDMNKMLMSANFWDKLDLLAALEVAERKREYMFRHPNFEMREATKWFNLVKDKPKVVASNKKRSK